MSIVNIWNQIRDSFSTDTHEDVGDLAVELRDNNWTQIKEDERAANENLAPGESAYWRPPETEWYDQAEITANDERIMAEVRATREEAIANGYELDMLEDRSPLPAHGIDYYEGWEEDNPEDKEHSHLTLVGSPEWEEQNEPYEGPHDAAIEVWNSHEDWDED